MTIAEELTTSGQQIPIAIVGVSAILPGSSDVAGFWRDVLVGRDLITDVPATHWLVEDYYDPDPAAPDKTYGRRGAFLAPVDFDPTRFGIPPTVIPATDTAQLLALVAADRVLADATGGRLAELDRERVSVILGTSSQQLLYEMACRLQRPVWLKALREAGIEEGKAQQICDGIAAHYVPWQEDTFPGLLGNVIAGRIANRLDLHGTNVVTDAACASSLSALSVAIDELALGKADLVVTGGVDTMNDILMFMCFSKTPALSPTGDCRPFAQAADGTILGEGLVMFALKRLSTAERDGDQVYAVIRGLGSSSDGRGGAIYSPVADGQARALRRAYQTAGYGPGTVGLVEAHGTGTRAGDAAEVAGLRAVFEGSGRTDRQWCALGSVKSQIGHTKSTSGAVGLLKAVLAVQHGILPATIKVDRPNPALDLDSSPFYLNTLARPWVQHPNQPRRAGVSSFGFGGSNFHVTVEEYQPQPQARAFPALRMRTAPAELVLLGAESAGELVSRCHELAEAPTSLVALARDSQADFPYEAPVRLAAVATDRADLVRKLEQAAVAIARQPDAPFSTPSGVHYALGAASASGTALLFSGQGSQYVGMGADLAMHLPQARAVWDAFAPLRFGGHRLDEVVFPVPAFTDTDRAAQAARLTATEWAQPALAAQSMAMLAVLAQLELRPDCLAGHSFGELVALHAGGALDAQALVGLARRRGELMRDAAARPGAMLAVSASIDVVRTVLGQRDGGDVWVANHNAPGQVVVSGTAEAIDALAAQLSGQEITVRRLAVSTAFHTPLVASAAEPLLEFLHGVQVDKLLIDVYSNADACPYPADPEGVRQGIAAQLAVPVRFVEQIEAMYARGVRTFVEVGAGSVLTDLVGQILNRRAHLAVSLDRKGRNGVVSLYEALGRLAVAGHRLNLKALWDGYAAPAAMPEKNRFTAPIKLVGANYGRPYPPPNGAAQVPTPNGAAGTTSMSSMPTPSSSPATSTAPASTAPAFRSAAAMPAAEPAPPASSLAGQVPTGPLEVDWLRTLESVAHQTAEAHLAYQQLMADSHAEFLKMAEASVAMLAGAGDVAALPPAPATQAPPATDAPLTTAAPLTSPPPPAQVAPPAAPDVLSTVADLLPADAVWGDPVQAVPGQQPLAKSLDLEPLLISIVADRTGYPTEMLASHLQLEADLGIDSIKRVEILSALRKEVPGLPELQPGDLGVLRTIGQIVERLRADATPEPDTAAGADTASASPPPRAVPDSASAPLVRLVVRTAAAPAPGCPMPGLGTGRLVVTDDGGGIAAHVVVGLAQHGVAAGVVSAIPDEVSGVIFLGGLRDVVSSEQAAEVNRAAFRAARTVAGIFQASGGLFVTVQDTGGSFGLDDCPPPRAWLGGVAALVRTAAREWPLASVKAIDLQRAGREPATIAATIVQELLTGGSTLDVGLRADGSRLIPAPQLAATEPASVLSVGPESVIVASGGGRGVTAAALLALASRYQPRLVLIGRTPLVDESAALRRATDRASLHRVLIDDVQRRGGTPNLSDISAEVAAILAGREVRGTVEALRRAGSQVRYLPVDVRDAPALADALAVVRQEWGPITGVVHGAGVLADRLIAEQTDAEYERVFSTKVDGLRALLAATAGDPLRLLVSFGSISAQVGNPGQCAYAMANSVLDHVTCVQARQRPDCLVRVISWGPWQGGMVGPELAEHFRRQAVRMIPIESGAHAFVAELQHPADAVRVIIAAGGDEPLTVGSAHRAAQVQLGRNHPYLLDHQLAGTPVVPVALVLEWLARAARRERSFGDVLVLRDLRVLRGIRLDGFPDTERLLHIRSRLEMSEGASRYGYELLGLELLDEDGTVAYRARADLRPPHPSDQVWIPPDAASPARPQIYDGHVLFHGPRFQAIQALDALSPAGVAATLAGVRQLGWSDQDDWQTDPLVSDGALQLALLWAEQVLGGAFLPMAVRQYRAWRRGPAGGPVRCLVRPTSARDDEAQCDIGCFDEDGTLRAELLGVELVRRPDQPMER